MNVKDSIFITPEVYISESSPIENTDLNGEEIYLQGREASALFTINNEFIRRILRCLVNPEA